MLFESEGGATPQQDPFTPNLEEKEQAVPSNGWERAQLHNILYTGKTMPVTLSYFLQWSQIFVGIRNREMDYLK